MILSAPLAPPPPAPLPPPLGHVGPTWATLSRLEPIWAVFGNSRALRARSARTMKSITKDKQHQLHQGPQQQMGRGMPPADPEK